jgi:hypothetical protein
VHWFKCDLRTKDNKGLHLASEKAKEKGVPLIGIYIVSPQDFEAYLTAPVRVDFILRTLEVLKEDLGKLDIPLYVETVEKRKALPGRILELLKEWNASHLYANAEYEPDELQREAKMVHSCLENGIAMDVVADTCVVSPGELISGTGKQYSVYTPWFRAWTAHVHSNTHLLDLFDTPNKNPSTARKNFATLFASKIPDAPFNKKLTDEEKQRFRRTRSTPTPPQILLRNHQHLRPQTQLPRLQRNLFPKRPLLQRHPKHPNSHPHSARPQHHHQKPQRGQKRNQDLDQRGSLAGFLQTRLNTLTIAIRMHEQTV